MLHKFIISMDGNGATCSRVVIALKSNSVLLKYDSPHCLYYFSHLIPWRHYIPIRSDVEVERIVQMELECPGLFRSIAAQGRACAKYYLTKDAVSQYAAELIRLYAATFPSALASPLDTQRAAPASTDPGEDATVPVIFECMGHIQNRGDTWAAGGEWLGEAGGKRAIEGIMLSWVDNVAGVSYQVVLQDGTLTTIACCGEFCGTRGRNTAIHGFRINLSGNAMGRLECRYSATFVDGSKVGPIAAGHICQSDTLARLESFQIELRSRTIHDASN